MSDTRSTLRHYGVALRALLILTITLGVGYPAAIWVVGLAAPAQANGSPVTVDGQVVGSRLIGQSWTDSDGNALPEWFQSRPSAAGDGYDTRSSGGSNQGTESETLLEAITQRQEAISELDGVEVSQIPADAVTASASGLDPDISAEYARLQVARVAATRGLEESDVRALVEANTVGRDAGYIGEPRVNVLALNIALAELAN